MTENNPFAAMMKAGQDWAKALNPALDSFVPKGFDTLWPTMPAEAIDAQIRLTVRHARAAGATKQEIAETIAQAAFFGGVPAMTRAMELATGAMEEDKE